jgi:small subunit ribosomal protein S17
MEKKTVQKNTPPVKKQTFKGIVVSDKMKDTVVVVVERYVKDTKYQKYITLRKRYKVHNPGNTKKVGEKVTIESCRPISRHKSFVVVETK